MHETAAAQTSVVTSTQQKSTTVTANLTSEFDAFRSLAHKLVRVPKSEIDKARESKPA